MKHLKLINYNHIFESLIFNTTAEDMLIHPETIERLNQIGDDDINIKIELDLAKTKNYKPLTYYRIENGSESGYAGLGNGLYLGRDLKALKNYYDIEDENLKVSTYKGNPNWLDLIRYEDLEAFEKELKDKNIKIINSNEIGEYVKSIGYDGIRYYDPQATGEEFVLFNTNKVNKIII